MMTKLEISGKSLARTKEVQDKYNQFKVTQVIEVQRLRGAGKKIKVNTTAENDIIDIRFDDGGEWISSAADFTEIFGEEVIRTRSAKGSRSTFEIPTTLDDHHSRGAGKIGLKLLSVLKPSNITKPEAFAREAAQALDDDIMPSPGLYRLDGKMGNQTFAPSKTDDHHYLLFIHGTCSSTKGSFSGLLEKGRPLKKEDQLQADGIWKSMRNQYPDKILGLDHKTVSVSPLQNALDLLNDIPTKSRLDIIAYSRGGIIADILARCDERNKAIGFRDSEIALMRRSATEDGIDHDDTLADLMSQINRKAKEKCIQVNRLIRVACPAQGTTLLSNRIDHFLNGLLWSIKLSFNAIVEPVTKSIVEGIYDRIRSFTMAVVHSKADPKIMPGLNAMIPDSTFQRILNSPNVEVNNHIAIIEGDAKVGGGILNSLKTILTNLFYWEDNDYVVHTRSMDRGASRRDGIHVSTSRNKHTNHFNYFNNDLSRLAIQDALSADPGATIPGYKYFTKPGQKRGVFLDFIDFKEEIGTSVISGTRPIVLLLPGIMGSILKVDGKKVWIDFGEIDDGQLKDGLSLESDKNVKADSIIGKYYSDLVEELQKSYDVSVFAYDWRESIAKAAAALKDRIGLLLSKDQPLKIIAHSMGGLVVKKTMSDPIWKKFNDARGSRFVMLGTPWLGSHLIMEVLTGQSGRVKQLAFLDTKYTKKELMKVFNAFPGICEMLPIESTKGDIRDINDRRDYHNPIFWKQLGEALKSDINDLIDKSALDDFKKFRRQNYKAKDLKNTIYIAGKAKSTTSGFRIKRALFGPRLQFQKTSKGDGSVTWSSGIPKELDSDNVYYTDTKHGNLACDKKIFPAILEILEKGATALLENTQIITRGDQESYYGQEEYVSNNRSEASDIIFGADLDIITNTTDDVLLNVSVSHGDLKYASYPVMVGHFEQDGIMSAEKALDWRLDNKLSQRHSLHIYPGKTGESLSILDFKNQPKGGLIVGLGDQRKLTPYNLEVTIHRAVIRYALDMRDTDNAEQKKKIAKGISSLLIGTSYGNLPMGQALEGIIRGIRRANTDLKNIDPKLINIEHVEFIELYDITALNAYQELKEIEKGKHHLNIKVMAPMKKKHGAQSRMAAEHHSGWWQQLSTQWEKGKKGKRRGKSKKGKPSLPKLIFRSSGRLARVEQDYTFTAEHIIDELLKRFSRESTWNPEMSKAIFEIMIPNSFKEILREQHHIIWKLDVKTASYPWEMFHDIDYSDDPTFVNAGFIRQLITDNFRPNPRIIRNKKAMVIGDPLYGGELYQLDAAKREGEMVHDMLDNSSMEPSKRINAEGHEILMDLASTKYKVLHIAGHGIYNPDENKVGVVLGPNLELTPGMLHNFSTVPEFVFINCCYSGAIHPKYAEYYEDRYRLAANVGTQFIKNGAEAVVITGWAVDDLAAEHFARVLYEQLLRGEEFGHAVRKARKSCYLAFKNSNTWGAYQCYGNPYYTLVDRKNGWNEEEAFITEQQVIVQLENLLEDSNSERDQDKIVGRLRAIMKRAERDGFQGGRIRELEATVYGRINKINEATDAYHKLRILEKAEYSVKAIEQFCNIRVKQIIKNLKGNNSQDDSDVVGQNDDLIVEIYSIVRDIESLRTIGETSERMSILGSAYKRLAQVSPTQPSAQQKKRGILDQKTCLEKMEAHYQAAYYKISDRFRDSIYPLCNWLAAHVLLKEGKPVEIEGLSEDPIMLLRGICDALDAEIKEYTDYWHDIAMNNVLLTQLLYAVTKQDVEDLKSKVINHYDNAWDLGGNPSRIQSEIERLDFIITIYGDNGNAKNKRRKSALGLIKKHLEDMIK